MLCWYSYLSSGFREIKWFRQLSFRFFSEYILCMLKALHGSRKEKMCFTLCFFYLPYLVTCRIARQKNIRISFTLSSFSYYLSCRKAWLWYFHLSFCSSIISKNENRMRKCSLRKFHSLLSL